MKQEAIRKIKETRKKAIAMFASLNGLGVVGFNKYYNDRKNRKIIPVSSYQESSGKAG
jgi:hypothetical protein